MIACIAKRRFKREPGKKGCVDPGERLFLSPERIKALGRRFVAIESTNEGKAIERPPYHKMVVRSDSVTKTQ